MMYEDSFSSIGFANRDLGQREAITCSPRGPSTRGGASNHCGGRGTTRCMYVGKSIPMVLIVDRWANRH